MNPIRVTDPSGRRWLVFEDADGNPHVAPAKGPGRSPVRAAGQWRDHPIWVVLALLLSCIPVAIAMGIDLGWWAR